LQSGSGYKSQTRARLHCSLHPLTSGRSAFRRHAPCLASRVPAGAVPPSPRRRRHLHRVESDSGTPSARTGRSSTRTAGSTRPGRAGPAAPHRPGTRRGTAGSYAPSTSWGSRRRRSPCARDGASAPSATCLSQCVTHRSYRCLARVGKHARTHARTHTRTQVLGVATVRFTLYSDSTNSPVGSLCVSRSAGALRRYRWVWRSHRHRHPPRPRRLGRRRRPRPRRNACPQPPRTCPIKTRF
jgi:hypothetical protein